MNTLREDLDRIPLGVLREIARLHGIHRRRRIKGGGLVMRPRDQLAKDIRRAMSGTFPDRMRRTHALIEGAIVHTGVKADWTRLLPGLYRHKDKPEWTVERVGRWWYLFRDDKQYSPGFPHMTRAMEQADDPDKFTGGYLR